MSPTIRIRPIQASEGTALRDIRLRAIRDTPEAFAVSLAETIAETEERWTAWATRSAAGDTSIMYVADAAGRWIGMAGGLLNSSHPDVAQLISMWVEGPYRGQGVGRHLVEHVVGWARTGGAGRLELWVTEGNSPAIHLYARCGFRMTGQSQPLPSDTILIERQMVRDL